MKMEMSYLIMKNNKQKKEKILLKEQIETQKFGLLKQIDYLKTKRKE